MKTLFIHPTDPSTAFLNTVYEDYIDWDNVTVIRGTRIPKHIIVDGLKNNDRIVFLGHGTEYGLLDIIGNRYVINSNFLQFFRNKEVICYWCNGNIFVEKYDLNAFSTGMFVSEIDEAIYYNLPPDQNLIDNSNELFCRILSRCIFDDIDVIKNTIERGYVQPSNPIVNFNRMCMGFDN